MQSYNVLIRPATPDDAAEIMAVINPIIITGRYTTFDKPFTVDEIMIERFLDDTE